MGRAVVHDLAGAREVRDIVVADFDRERAQEVARKFGDGKASGLFADVRDTRRLAKVLRGCEVVVNCTQYNWNLEVMRAALAARVLAPLRLVHARPAGRAARAGSGPSEGS